MKPRKLLARIQGNPHNVAFRDFAALLDALGFELVRHDGSSHRIYAHPKVSENLSVQDRNGEAKPYQIKQLLALVDAYDLRID